MLDQKLEIPQKLPSDKERSEHFTGLYLESPSMMKGFCDDLERMILSDQEITTIDVTSEEYSRPTFTNEMLFSILQKSLISTIMRESIASKVSTLSALRVLKERGAIS